MTMPQRLSTHMLRANLLCRHCNELFEDADAILLPERPDEPADLVCPGCRRQLVEYDIDQQQEDVDDVATLLRQWAAGDQCPTARDVLRAAATLERVSDFITQR